MIKFITLFMLVVIIALLCGHFRYVESWFWYGFVMCLVSMSGTYLIVCWPVEEKPRGE